MTGADVHAATDAELAHRVTCGDAPEAEAALARRFAPRVRLYGLRHLRASDRAEDLVQEVLMTVLQALRAGRVEDVAVIDRFVLGTCRNVVHGWRRGERRRDALAAAVAAEEVEAALVPPRAPEALQVMRCLHALPPREHAVLVLSFVEERTSDDIARMLELSEGNVRVIRHRAVKQVRACVDAGGPA